MEPDEIRDKLRSRLADTAKDGDGTAPADPAPAAE
jgi:hypothetical protein